MKKDIYRIRCVSHSRHEVDHKLYVPITYRTHESCNSVLYRKSPYTDLYHLPVIYLSDFVVSTFTTQVSE
jgi:hypothetical protein